MSRSSKLVGWVLGALLAAVGLSIWALEWNDLRSPLSRWASRAIDREVVIAGDLEVDLGRVIGVRLDQVRIANAPWSATPTMAEIDTLRIEIPLSWGLLRGNPEFRSIELEQPALRLERNAAGEVNWDFLLEEEPQGEPPQIDALWVREGVFVYEDAVENALVEGLFFTERGRMEVRAEGTYRDASLQVRASGGDLPAILTAEPPFHIDLHLWYAAQYVGAQGEIAGDLDAPVLRVDVTAEGSELGVLLRPIDPSVSELGPFRITARMVLKENRWRAEGIEGHLGETRLKGGRLTADPTAAPPHVGGDLHFARLDLAGLMERFAFDEPRPEPEQLIPEAPIPVGWLDTLRADLTARADEVSVGPVDAHNLELGVRVDEGMLHIIPLRLDVADGQVQAELQLGTRAGQPSFHTDIRLGRASFHAIFRDTPAVEFLRGRLSGHLELRGRGHTLAEALGQSDGRLGLLLSRGAIDSTLAEGIALNIIELLFGNGTKQQLRCAVVGLEIRDGTMVTDVLVVDTEERVIVGEGSVDLRSEELQLEFDTRAKEPGSLAAQTPVTIKGSLRDPDLGIKGEELAPRGIAALALSAVVGPLAGLLPFIEPGEGEDRDCRALVDETSADLPPP